MSLLATHFQDRRHTLGSHLFTADAIVAFARKYDPQRFHVDAELARQSVFGGLCASGWHTTAAWMRKNVEYLDALRSRWAEEGLPPLVFGPSPGIRNLRWLRPVYAGEEIVFYSTATSERPLASRPGWHMLEHVAEAETADGTPVMRFEAAVLIGLGDRAPDRGTPES